MAIKTKIFIIMEFVIGGELFYNIGVLANVQEIAFKRLARSSSQGVQELINEVAVISKLQHQNLLRLLGCCVECEENMLVYEYMPNGSLDAYIFDSHKQRFLDWRQRVIIVEGICRDLNPKISDFGIARISEEKKIKPIQQGLLKHMATWPQNMQYMEDYQKNPMSLVSESCC